MPSNVPRHDGFNKWQIKEGYIVLMLKDGRVARRVEKYSPKKSKGDKK